MNPEEIHHLTAELPKGKCNMSLRSILLLTRHIEETEDIFFDYYDVEDGKISTFVACYNVSYLTPDSHLYNLNEDYLCLASQYGDLTAFQKKLKYIKRVICFALWMEPLVYYKQLDIIHLVITHNKYLMNEFLCQAAESGWLELVKQLIDRGATDLHNSIKSAEQYGHKHVVKYLQSVVIK